MKSVFRKYLYLCIAALAVEAVVLVIVIIDIINSTNTLGWWAEILSILPVCIIMGLFYLGYRKSVKSRALNRVHEWMKNAILILADYRQRDETLHDSPSIRYEGIQVLINALKTHSNTTLADARQAGGELAGKTEKVVDTILSIDNKLGKHDDSAFEDLKNLQHDLAEIMMSAFEKIKRLD